MSKRPTYEELEKRVTELEESKEFFENILDMLPELVSYIDKNHTFKFGNRAYQKFFNIDPATMTDIHPREVLGAEAFQEVEPRHKAALSGQEQEYESTFLLPNGDPYYFHAHYLPHKEKDQIKGFLAVVQDITDRKLAEEKSRESEAKYRMLFENAVDAIFVADPDTGYLIDVNKKAEELTGYNRTELVGKHQSFIHPSEDADFYEQEFQKSIKSEGAKFREMLVQTRDGLNVPVEINAGGTIQSAEGKLHIGIFRNISERKQTEMALKESEERFKLAMESVNDGLYDWNLKTNEIYYSPVWKSLLGYADDELPNDFSVWEKLTDPNDVERSWKMQNELINRKKDRFEIEFKMKHKDGHWVDILSRAKAIFNEENEAIKIIGTHVDITERKQSVEEIDRIFELSPDLIGFGNITTGYYTRVNPAYEIFGRPLDEFLTRPYVEFIHPDDHNATATIVKTMISGQSISGFVNRYRCKDGSYRTIEWRATEAQSDGSVCVAGRDITDRLQRKMEKENLEKQLRQSQKMEAVGTLAGGIAHDFNNILGIILGNAELAMDDVPEWNPARQNLDEVKKASLRAKDVVRQILSFSRKSEIEQKPINIAPMVTQSLKLSRASIPTNIEIRQNIANDVDDILGDPTQIHQVMINLCVNAAHAMENDGGILEVTLENTEVDEDTASQYPELNPGPHVNLSVSDTGDGINPEIMDRVFDPYFTTKDVGKGTGMGLAVVHGIVKSHHGSILLESKLGKGATFKILFPAFKEKVRDEPKDAQELPIGNERILFVDDEESMVNLNQQRLERLGYKVIPRTNPSEALKYFQTHPDQIDLLITDMAMPKMTGDRLAQEILKIRPDMPIILCTGYSERMSDERAQEIGIRKYVEKPIEKETMAMSVREVLDGQ
jgi:PAS domain S-box-containing protein